MTRQMLMVSTGATFDGRPFEIVQTRDGRRVLVFLEEGGGRRQVQTLSPRSHDVAETFPPNPDSLSQRQREGLESLRRNLARLVRRRTNWNSNFCFLFIHFNDDATGNVIFKEKYHNYTPIIINAHHNNATCFFSDVTKTDDVTAHYVRTDVDNTQGRGAKNHSNVANIYLTYNKLVDRHRNNK
uniref:Uncharacterized protein n=1 Tax=Magallana gigas TaxID=29159 RepID=K1PIE3_MAGGI